MFLRCFCKGNSNLGNCNNNCGDRNNYINCNNNCTDDNYFNNCNNNCNNFPISRPCPTIIINRPTGITGPIGPTGPTGATGADGVTPTFTIGTVTTLEPECDATVTITGTAPDYILNFGIPRGVTGEGPVN